MRHENCTPNWSINLSRIAADNCSRHMSLYFGNQKIWWRIFFRMEHSLLLRVAKNRNRMSIFSDCNNKRHTNQNFMMNFKKKNTFHINIGLAACWRACWFYCYWINNNNNKKNLYFYSLFVHSLHQMANTSSFWMVQTEFHYCSYFQLFYQFIYLPGRDEIQFSISKSTNKICS